MVLRYYNFSRFFRGRFCVWAVSWNFCISYPQREKIKSAVPSISSSFLVVILESYYLVTIFQIREHLSFLLFLGLLFFVCLVCFFEVLILVDLPSYLCFYFESSIKNVHKMEHN